MNRLLLLTFALICLAPCQAQVFGTVDALSGSATISDASGTSVAASVGQKIMRGQTIATQANAELHAVTEDGAFVALRPNSLFQVLEYNAAKDATGQVAMSLLKGALRSITGWIGKLNPQEYRVITPTATIGIRGTDHETLVVEADSGRDRPGTYDSVREGATVIRTAQGELRVEAGQHGFAPADASALRMLDQVPESAEKRELRIEERIEARKETLVRLLRRVLAESGQTPSELRDRMENATDEQRDAVRRTLRRKLQQRKVN